MKIDKKISDNHVKISWPGDEDVFLTFYGEEDDPAVITDLMGFLVGSSPTTPLPDGDERTVDFCYIDYPDKIRFFLNGKRLSLQDAHERVEATLYHSITTALEHLEKQEALEGK